ncbi:hypothetical protein BDZ94DRAFT_1306624 [Collybia nuda]|uniref:Uncharacterized protein n=1 Tax=Collybia nuda TaxID=64659 RepID=A0A9P5YDX0_9AGAR|nr:hypothetical protein BDZ94DRAFT_1306624 [Collybia nuda]
MHYPGEGQATLWPTTFLPYVGAVLFESFLYGIYAVLFGTCMFLLVRRGRTSHKVLFVTAIVMFILATTDIVYTYYLLFTKSTGYTYGDARPKYVLYVTTNFVADTLLIYRFYKVWYPNIYVATGLVILLILTTTCGFILDTVNFQLSIYSWGYPTINLVLNVTITSLVVGRIWRAGSDTVQYRFNCKDMSPRYRNAIFIFVESGIIYSIYILFDLGFRRVPVVFVILEVGFVQFVGIVPTLILVQSGLVNGIKNSRSSMVSSAFEYNSV